MSNHSDRIAGAGFLSPDQSGNGGAQPSPSATANDASQPSLSATANGARPDTANGSAPASSTPDASKWPPPETNSIADPLPFTLIHHGGRNQVTGSCHEVRLSNGRGILVDCGLAQGEDAERGARSAAPAGSATSSTGQVGTTGSGYDWPSASRSGPGPGARSTTPTDQAGDSDPDAAPNAIEFPIDHLAALVVTHAHIDHVGRIPYLLAAGFKGPIVCSQPTAELLPLVLEDAVKVGLTRNRRLIEAVVDQVKSQIVGLPYKQWHELDTGDVPARVKLKPAGHIMGSAYVEFGIRAAFDPQAGARPREARLVFSGDLGAPYAPLLPAPRPPWRADVLVLESTYGDGLHPDRRNRRRQLAQVLEHSLEDGGTVMIPAFSLGRTQELLYEIEGIIHRRGDSLVRPGLPWDQLEIVVDSPLASRFTQVFRRLKPFWDAEARRRIRHGRHPLSFDQLYTVGDHRSHLNAVEYLAETGRPAVVIAAGGMCTGGRIVNYLKAMVGDPRNDILFVGYQAAGTPGRAILTYGPTGGYVRLDGTKYTIRAQVHTLRSYSAHADQAGLVRFASRMRHPPGHIRLAHGEPPAQEILATELRRTIPGVMVD